MIRGTENYQFLKKGFSPVIDEINDLIDGRFVEVNGEIVEVDFVLGGDYKVSYAIILLNVLYMYLVLAVNDGIQCRPHNLCLYLLSCQQR